MCAYSVFNTFPVYPLSAKPLILLAFCRYRYHTSLFNRPLFDENDLPYDIICGTFFVAGLGVEDFVSLTEEQIRRYKEHYDRVMVLTAAKETTPQHKPPHPHKYRRGVER